MEPVARINDGHACPIHGSNSITSGGRAKVDGRKVARVGDSTGCGAKIIEGSSQSKDEGQPIAYRGCATSHGGVITSGSSTAKVKP